MPGNGALCRAGTVRRCADGRAHRYLRDRDFAEHSDDGAASVSGDRARTDGKDHPPVYPGQCFRTIRFGGEAEERAAVEMIRKACDFHVWMKI